MNRSFMIPGLGMEFVIPEEIPYNISSIYGPGPRNRAKRLKAKTQRKKMKMHHRRRG
jgi:hypothetical protein